jgi:hypothetical protein
MESIKPRGNSKNSAVTSLGKLGLKWVASSAIKLSVLTTSTPRICIGIKTVDTEEISGSRSKMGDYVPTR